VTDKDQKLRQELADTKKKLKEKERELRLKEKALAEMAALLTLKKSRRDLVGRRGRLIAFSDSVARFVFDRSLTAAGYCASNRGRNQ
jgi:hypothetical protein